MSQNPEVLRTKMKFGQLRAIKTQLGPIRGTSVVQKGLGPKYFSKTCIKYMV